MEVIPDYLWRDTYKAYMRAFEEPDDSADLSTEEIKNFLDDEFCEVTAQELQDFINANSL